MQDTYENWLHILRSHAPRPDQCPLYWYWSLGCFIQRLDGIPPMYDGKTMEDAISDLGMSRDELISAMILHDRCDEAEIRRMEKLNLNWPMVQILTAIDTRGTREAVAAQASQERWSLDKLADVVGEVCRQEMPALMQKWKEVARKHDRSESN